MTDNAISATAYEADNPNCLCFHQFARASQDTHITGDDFQSRVLVNPFFLVDENISVF